MILPCRLQRVLNNYYVVDMCDIFREMMSTREPYEESLGNCSRCKQPVKLQSRWGLWDEDGKKLSYASVEVLSEDGTPHRCTSEE